MNLNSLDEKTKHNLLSWLNGPYDEGTKSEILSLLKKDPKEIASSFFQTLSFGTGGARAIMGIGTNRLNIYTIRALTQGLSNYLIKFKKKPSVIVGFDNRNNSAQFAKEAASVLAGNGIKVFLFKELRPTPLVSFGCRYKKCDAAIMITASHNPPEYNGFKVYWNDGAQVLPPHDVGIINEVDNIHDPSQIKTNPSGTLISYIGDEIDAAYIKKLSSLQNFKKECRRNGDDLKIIYTNLHGTGITLIPKCLNNWGFNNISPVEKQKTIDGNFTFAPHPNPEEKEALSLGIEDLLSKKGDILIATDPDADRMAVVINHNGKAHILSGNQIAVILLNHLLLKAVPKNSAVIKTIVTTELIKSLADAAGCAIFDVLTGFKYIAEKIRVWEKEKSYHFLFGAEESYGYLPCSFVRDKDAVSSACLIAECALLAKREGKTLIDILNSIYEKYGVFREKQFSISFPEGKESMLKMSSIMENLRLTPPSHIGSHSIIVIEDYEKQLSFNLKTKKKNLLSLPKSNVLRFFLDDHTKVVIRPSGTEPKIKVYIDVSENDFTSIEEGIRLSDEKLSSLESAIKNEILYLN